MVERRVRIITSVLAQATVLAALLFYFGYVALTAEYGYFGLTLSTLGFTYQEVLLRSVEVIYVPLGAILIATLAAIWLHTGVRRALAAEQSARLLAVAGWVLVAVGLLAFARGVVGVVIPNIARTETIATTPLSLGFGVGAVAYGRHLITVLPRKKRSPAGWGRPVALSAVASLLILSLFWAANSFASAYGRGRAVAAAVRLDGLPGVVLDTTEPLYADLPDMDVQTLPSTDGQRFHFRHNGLRLLAESGGRLFLVPGEWDPSTSVVLVVPVAEARLQYYPGSG